MNRKRPSSICGALNKVKKIQYQAPLEVVIELVIVVNEGGYLD